MLAGRQVVWLDHLEVSVWEGSFTWHHKMKLIFSQFIQAMAISEVLGHLQEVQEPKNGWN